MCEASLTPDRIVFGNVENLLERDLHSPSEILMIIFIVIMITTKNLVVIVVNLLKLCLKMSRTCRRAV